MNKIKMINKSLKQLIWYNKKKYNNVIMLKLLMILIILIIVINNIFKRNNQNNRLIINNLRKENLNINEIDYYNNLCMIWEYNLIYFIYIYKNIYK